MFYCYTTQFSVLRSPKLFKYKTDVRLKAIHVVNILLFINIFLGRPLPVQILLQRVRHAVRHAVAFGRRSPEEGIGIRLQVGGKSIC